MYNYRPFLLASSIKSPSYLLDQDSRKQGLSDVLYNYRPFGVASSIKKPLLTFSEDTEV